MPLIVWELDEIAEAILGIYGAIIGLIILLVILERDPTQKTPREPRRQPHG
jgi:hypothetical protein